MIYKFIQYTTETHGQWKGMVSPLVFTDYDIEKLGEMIVNSAQCLFMGHTNCMVHALRTEEGREWDTVNGWRIPFESITSDQFDYGKESIGYQMAVDATEKMKKETNKRETNPQDTERSRILQEGIDLTLNSRNDKYGAPNTNLRCQMELWTIYKTAAGEKHSASHDAAMQHVMAKIARIACGAPMHRDNYIDGATYLAIAYENDFNDLSDEQRFAPFTK